MSLSPNGPQEEANGAISGRQAGPIVTNYPPRPWSDCLVECKLTATLLQMTAKSCADLPWPVLPQTSTLRSRGTARATAILSLGKESRPKCLPLSPVLGLWPFLLLPLTWGHRLGTPLFGSSAKLWPVSCDCLAESALHLHNVASMVAYLGTSFT